MPCSYWLPAVFEFLTFKMTGLTLALRSNCFPPRRQPRAPWLPSPAGRWAMSSRLVRVVCEWREGWFLLGITEGEKIAPVSNLSLLFILVFFLYLNFVIWWGPLGVILTCPEFLIYHSMGTIVLWRPWWTPVCGSFWPCVCVSVCMISCTLNPSTLKCLFWTK